MYPNNNNRIHTACVYSEKRENTNDDSTKYVRVNSEESHSNDNDLELCIWGKKKKEKENDTKYVRMNSEKSQSNNNNVYVCIREKERTKHNNSTE